MQVSPSYIKMAHGSKTWPFLNSDWSLRKWPNPSIFAGCLGLRESVSLSGVWPDGMWSTHWEDSQRLSHFIAVGLETPFVWSMWEYKRKTYTSVSFPPSPPSLLLLLPLGAPPSCGALGAKVPWRRERQLHDLPCCSETHNSLALKGDRGLVDWEWFNNLVWP